MVQILGSEVYSPAAGVKEMTEEMLEQRLTECGIPFSPDLPGKLLKYHEPVSYTHLTLPTTPYV